MKAIRLKIIDLLDKHEGEYSKCKGCTTCTEIKNLRKSLVRAPVEKCKPILDKGKEMTKSDIALLLDMEVPKKKIALALKLNQTDFSELMRNWGFARAHQTQEEPKEEEEMAKITAEEYQDLKALGLSDVEIATRKDMSPIYLRNWKYTNGIKGRKRAGRPIVEKILTPKNETPRKDKTTEMRQLMNDLGDSNKEKDKTIKELQKQVQELENLNAACSDVENESNSLQVELADMKKKADGYLQQLLDTRHELITKDYALENQSKALENTRKTLERYERENKALRELVSLWV